MFLETLKTKQTFITDEALYPLIFEGRTLAADEHKSFYVMSQQTYGYIVLKSEYLIQLYDGVSDVDYKHRIKLRLI